jgi:hypothetical protein
MKSKILVLFIFLLGSCLKVNHLTEIVIEDQKKAVNQNITKSKHFLYLDLISREDVLIPNLIDKFDSVYKDDSLIFNLLIGRTEVTAKIFGKIWNRNASFYFYEKIDFNNSKAEFIITSEELDYFSDLSHILQDIEIKNYDEISRKSKKRSIEGGSHFIYSKIVATNNHVDVNSIAFYEYSATD